MISNPGTHLSCVQDHLCLTNHHTQRIIPVRPPPVLDEVNSEEGLYLCSQRYLIASCIMALVDAHNTVGKVAQCVQAVTALLQSAERNVLVVRNPVGAEGEYH